MPKKLKTPQVSNLPGRIKKTGVSDRQARSLAKKARAQSRKMGRMIVHLKQAVELRQNELDEQELIRDPSSDSTKEQMVASNHVPEQPKEAVIEEVKQQEAIVDFDPSGKRKNPSAPILNKPRKIKRNRFTLDKSEMPMHMELNDLKQPEQTISVPFPYFHQNQADNCQELLIFLEAVTKNERAPNAGADKRTVDQIYQEEAKFGRLPQLLMWNFKENSYEELLNSLSLKLVPLDPKVHFSPMMLFELIYTAHHDKELQLAINQNFRSKSKSRPIITGLDQVRRTLCNSGNTQYCENCGEQSFTNRSRHNKDCHLKDPSKQSYLRIGARYLCVLCLRWFCSQRHLAIHMSFHNFFDVFFFGYDFKVLLRWEGITAAQIELALQEAPPRRPNVNGQFEWLKADRPGFINTALQRTIARVKDEPIRTEPVAVESPKYEQVEDQINGRQQAFIAGSVWGDNESVMQMESSVPKPVLLKEDDIREIWQALLKLAQINTEEGDSPLKIIPSNGGFIAAGVHGALCVGYPWQFFKTIKGGVDSLVDGIELMGNVLIAYGEMAASNHFVHKIVHRFWGFEIHYNVPVDDAIRCQTTQSVAMSWEKAIDISDNAELFKAARNLHAKLVRVDALCTDIWRPCFWIRTRAHSDVEAKWHFIGHHTIMHKKSGLYWKRRTMILDMVQHYAAIQSSPSWADICIDSVQQLFGLCLLIVSNMHALPVPECRDTTATSQLFCTKALPEIAKFLQEFLNEDNESKKIGQHLKYFLVTSSTLKASISPTLTASRLISDFRKNVTIFGRDYADKVRERITEWIAQGKAVKMSASNHLSQGDGSESTQRRPFDAFNLNRWNNHETEPIEEYLAVLKGEGVQFVAQMPPQSPVVNHVKCKDSKEEEKENKGQQ